MKISGKELRNRMEEALRACLNGVPFLEIQRVRKETQEGGVQPDLFVELISASGSQSLIVETKTSGQPRLTRQAVNQILRYLEVFPNAYGVLFAPYVSPNAAEICAKEGIGYLDLSGNCRLCFGQVYVEREGKPNQFLRKRDLRSLYSARATRILRVLLTNPKKEWKVVELAEEADVSLGHVANVKKLLADHEWIRTEPRGITLNKPEELLSEWAENYSFRQNEIRDYYSFNNSSGVEVALAELCATKGIRYALTGFSGAVRMAPAVRYQRVYAYVDCALEDVALQLKLKEVAGGANVTLLSAYDEGVFYGLREFEGIRTASPVQIYLDLLSLRGRGEEAARSLLEEVIKPEW